MEEDLNQEADCQRCGETFKAGDLAYFDEEDPAMNRCVLCAREEEKEE